MIQELPQPGMPEWLQGPADLFRAGPLPDLQSGSVFYPGCGFDERPVKVLAGNYFTFVYADCDVEPAEVRRQLGTFKGYRPIYDRDVAPEELAPGGWPPNRWRAGFFAVWGILERSREFSREHGPLRFLSASQLTTGKTTDSPGPTPVPSPSIDTKQLFPKSFSVMPAAATLIDDPRDLIPSPRGRLPAPLVGNLSMNLRRRRADLVLAPLALQHFVAGRPTLEDSPQERRLRSYSPTDRFTTPSGSTIEPRPAENS
jgi:hypothetical protein